MSDIKLIYFEGCPKAEDARSLLSEVGVEFEVIQQDSLEEQHPLLEYSSPTILNGNEILFGQHIGPSSSACSAEKFDRELIAEKLRASSGKSPSSSTGVAGFATFGSFGSALIVGLCPLCIPAIGAFLGAVGLGFLFTENAVLSLFFAFFAVTIAGFLWSYLKEHRHAGPLVIAVLSGTALYVGRYVYIGGLENMILMYGGIAAIITASLWNLHLRKRPHCPACV